MTCTVPPSGWLCTRHRGHTGPCAAIPDSLEHSIVAFEGWREDERISRLWQAYYFISRFARKIISFQN